MSAKAITSETELNDLIAAEGPVWVLKHSNTCPVSTYAKHEFDAFVDESDATAGVVIVQEARPVSNHIAEATGITHESPQALLYVGGEVQWHASHGAILARDLKKAEAEVVG